MSLHSKGRCYLGGEVKMSIDVGRCIEVTVSQPFLYTFKRDTACYKQTCAAVSQIVEPDLINVVLIAKLFTKSLVKKGFFFA